MRHLALIRALGATCALCACVPVESAPRSPGGSVYTGEETVLRAAVVTREGSLRIGDRVWNLVDPATARAAAPLLLELVDAGEGTLIVLGERGAPFEAVEALMALLEEAAIESYRLELGALD